MRRSTTGGLLVRVGAGERVTAGRRPLVRLVRRYQRVRLRIEDPGLLLEPQIQDLLDDLLSGDHEVLSEVIVDAVSFDLGRPFDASGLRWLVNGCRAGVLDELYASDHPTVPASPRASGS